MNRNLIIGIVAVVAITIAAGVALKNKNGGGSDVTLPIIQITTPSAYLLGTNGARSKELSDGDTLVPPATVQVTEDSLASVNFPDGSIARIQGGTISLRVSRT